jgi:hypothetical protein
MRRATLAAAPIMFILYMACGGGTPPAAAPPSPPPEASEKPVAAPEKTSEPEAKDAGAPVASAEPTSKRPSATGRPMAIYNGVSQPTTVGSDGAVFRLDNGAELRIPSRALLDPRNILFVVDKKARASAGKIGEVYDVAIQMPDAAFRVGEETLSQPYTSHGDPFVIKLPLPQGTQSASIAIENIVLEPKTNRQKSMWSVGAMTKMETADAGNKAVFELQNLPDGHVHLTTSAPTAAPAP